MILFILQSALVWMIRYTVPVLGWASPEADSETRIWMCKVNLGGDPKK